VRFSWRTLSGICGLALGLGVSVVYAYIGFKPAMPYLLVAGVGAVAFSFQRSPISLRSAAPSRSDLVAVGILLLVMAPLYWWRLYSTPWQINSDELTIMVVAKQLINAPQTDLFGVSSIFGFPSAVFVFVGRLAESLGGIDLYHSRVVHSTLGMGCVLLAYGFFRQFMEELRAGTLAVILGANHALFAISRMAMRENTGLFLELLALWLLARGFQRRSRADIFLAGATTGLAFYAYFPARITLVIVLALLCGIPVMNARREVVKLVGGYTAIFLLGWALVAAPVMIASRANSDWAFAYTRQQFLIYPEGRKLEQDWTGEKTPAGAWKANIRNGLTMFNSRMHDQGYIYPNYKHGFVDPITGVLLWLGFVVAGARVVRNRRRLLSNMESGAATLADLTALVGFLTLYLSSALVITKAPNYTRLLVVLPFVSYLAGTALWALADWLTRRLSDARESMRVGIACVGVVLIALWNISIFNDFVAVGRRHGNDVGSTGRYVEARKNAVGYTWVLAADKTHPYYSWGEAWQWKTWVGFFAGPNQTMQVSPLAELSSLNLPGSFTVFITNAVWQSAEAEFRVRHPLYEVNWLTPDGRFLAVDVRGTR
jgi:4-amino-4-deoxy-L-arabinose transferase-like glycosyltransferase